MIRPKWLRDKGRKFEVDLTVDNEEVLWIWLRDFRGLPFLNLRCDNLDLQDIIDNLREYDVRWDEN